MKVLLVKCPNCGYENVLGEEAAKVYNSAFAFGIDRKCASCDHHFDETDTQEADYRFAEIDKLEKALLLACERIADSSQTYEEANTADVWKERFLENAGV